MNRGLRLRITAVGAIGVIGVSLFLNLGSGPGPAPDFDCATEMNPTTVSIDVSSGESGIEIARELFDKGVTASSEIFFRLAVADPKAQLIAPGVHVIDRQICAEQALTQLLDSRRIAGLISVGDGAWISEIKKSFVAAGYPKDQVEEAFAASPPKPFTRLEGLIFPAQYSFAQGTSAQTALSTMLARGVSEASQAGLLDDKSSLTAQELLTIASIIQAEGGDGDFAKVSRVIYNRLKIGMPLQMDSTVHYIMESRGNVFLSTKSTLIKSPYNTYQRYGLPPGPIGNPGKDAMRAAIAPAAGDWLYFITVAPQDTRFTSSFDEFNGWKVLYKKNLREGKFEGK